jgi:hypothetical protein
MIARFLKTYSRRRWLYAIGEITALSIFGLCALAVFTDRHYQLRIDDTGISPFTAACVAVLSLIVFITIVIVREQDEKV